MKVCFSMVGIASNRGGVRRYAERLAGALASTRREGDALEILEGRPRRFSIDKHLHSWSLRLRRDFDLLHVPNVYAPWFRTPFYKVVTVHDLTPLLLPWSHMRRNVWHHRWMLDRILAAADHVIAVSEASRRDLARLCALPGGKVSVIGEAAGPEFLAAERRDPGAVRHILSVGAREPRKNLAGLLAAYRILRGRGVSLPLVVAGPRGWGGGLPRRLVSQEGVVWKGFVDGGELLRLYREAAVLVYPSFYEGFGLPVLEAMAAGTPVVTADRGALPETAGDAALFADPASPGEIADAVGRVLGDRALWTRLSERGRERARRFSWEEAARRTWEVYRNLCGAWRVAEKGVF